MFYSDREPDTATIGASDRRALAFITGIPSMHPPVDQRITMEMLGKSLMKGAKSNHPIGSIALNTTDYNVAGNPAARVEYTTKYKETPVKVVDLRFVNDGKVYEIVMLASDARFSDYKATFGHMLSSFKVNGQ